MKLQGWYSFAALCAVVIIAEIMCPYTKVEESFGMQALHDFIFCRTTACGDHIAFPGVVPRSFFGPWLTVVFALVPLILFVKPITAILLPFILQKVSVPDNLLGNLALEVFLLQYPLLVSHACRIVLGGLVCSSLWYVGSSIDIAESMSMNHTKLQDKFGGCIPSFVFFLLCISQFHLIFYATRPLPNTYGLILCTFACGCALRKHYYRSIAILCVAAAIFRCDVIVLLVPYTLFLLLRRDITLLRAVLTGLTALAVALLCSVGMDSFLWGRWLWPESLVLLFNTAENQSWRWGTSPAHAYISHLLPRAFILYFPLLLLMVGLAWFPIQHWRRGRMAIQRLSTKVTALPLWIDVSIRYRVLLIPASLFIALYSTLPHKELRFSMLVFPWFLASLASAIAGTWNMYAFAPSKKVINQTSSVNKRVKKTERKIKSEDPKRNHYAGKKLGIILLLLMLYLLQLATVGISLHISMYNYPGARALQQLHQEIKNDIQNSSSCLYKRLLNGTEKNTSITVFIDAYAGMNGVNRFQKIHYSPYASYVDTNNNDRIVYDSLQRRLLALLALPFVATHRIMTAKNPSTGRWSEYVFSDVFGKEPIDVKMLNFTVDGVQIHVGFLGKTEIRYIKDPTRFDEERNTYNSQGLDYLLVRYSQKKLHHQHGEFEEIFTTRIIDWKVLAKQWLAKLLPWRKPFTAVSAEEEEEGFLLGMRRRCP
ncbi:GPI mannosyltransferase [Trypanosoma melophagium]|uniref:GPI mannosyltransferase n=1 Tax=Trypanosoma melophagium TaxID=715481 RepID=UPI00351A3F5C|nr:GPI mannosyltransferase [Trypanosoma melophagium]